MADMWRMTFQNPPQGLTSLNKPIVALWRTWPHSVPEDCLRTNGRRGMAAAAVRVRRGAGSSRVDPPRQLHPLLPHSKREADQ